MDIYGSYFNGYILKISVNGRGYKSCERPASVNQKSTSSEKHWRPMRQLRSKGKRHPSLSVYTNTHSSKKNSTVK